MCFMCNALRQKKLYVIATDKWNINKTTKKWESIGQFDALENYSLVIEILDCLFRRTGTEEVKPLVSCGCSSISWASPDPLLWNLDNHIYQEWHFTLLTVIQRFSIPVLAPPLCIFSMSLFVNTLDSDNQLVRCALHAWTLFRLTCSLHRAHCSLHSVHCSLHSVHCSLHRVHCSPHRVHCSPHRVHCSPHRVHCSPHRVHCSPHRVHCSLPTQGPLLPPHTGSIAPHTGSIAPHTGSIAPSLHRVHCSPHSVHCSPHSVHCSLPTQGPLLPTQGPLLPTQCPNFRWSLLYFGTFIHGFALRNVFTHGRVWHHISL